MNWHNTWAMHTHTPKTCKTRQACPEPLERDKIDEGTSHRRKQEINSLCGQEALYFFFLSFSFCLLCIKILLSARSVTNSSAFLEENDGGACA